MGFAVAIMTHPFEGPPALPFNTSNDATRPNATAVPFIPEIDKELAALPRPRKYYRRIYTTREADHDMRNCPQGLHAFFHAYYYYKSADRKENKPFPLKARTAEELAKMPTYYVMDLHKNIRQTVAEHMPSTAEIETCKWLTDEDRRRVRFRVRADRLPGRLERIYRRNKAQPRRQAECRAANVLRLHDCCAILLYLRKEQLGSLSDSWRRGQNKGLCVHQAIGLSSGRGRRAVGAARTARRSEQGPIEFLRRQG
jgi:hypothetical protein